MKSAHSCRVCSRWLEGEWGRAGSDAERDALQALMDRGYCDKPGCEAEAARRAETAERSGINTTTPQETP